MNPTTVIVSCTQKSSSQSAEILLYQSFQSGGLGGVCKLEMVWENTEGLSAVYNRKILEHANSGVEFLVFVHDDVYIDDLKIHDKLRQAYQSFGFQIIGAAGAAAINIAYPTLWHVMAEREHQRGFVHHSAGGAQTTVTNFGPTPSEVLVMDGLFMAIHLPSIVASGWKFNEKYRFHHYDISSCIDAFKMGIKMGVFPIHLIHLSRGLASMADEKWLASNNLFLADYGPKKTATEGEQSVETSSPQGA